jgi:hypothetical protein
MSVGRAVRFRRGKLKPLADRGGDWGAAKSQGAESAIPFAVILAHHDADAACQERAGGSGFLWLEDLFS